MSHRLYACILILGTLLVSGCTGGSEILDIARSSSTISEFLAEYPTQSSAYGPWTAL